MRPMSFDGTTTVMALLLVAMGTAAAESPPVWQFPEHALIGEVTRGVCEGCAKNRDVEDCRDFTLTRTQVRTLLSRAQPITQQQLTQYYQGSPCLVRGTARWDETEIRFEISAFLIATVWLKDGKQLLACDGPCEQAVLSPGASAPATPTQR